MTNATYELSATFRDAAQRALADHSVAHVLSETESTPPEHPPGDESCELRAALHDGTSLVRAALIHQADCGEGAGKHRPDVARRAMRGFAPHGQRRGNARL